MGCPSCGTGKQKNAVCEVHFLVDGDGRERLVKWCELCQAFICDSCRSNMFKRAQAAAIRAGRNIFGE